MEYFSILHDLQEWKYSHGPNPQFILWPQYNGSTLYVQNLLGLVSTTTMSHYIDGATAGGVTRGGSFFLLPNFAKGWMPWMDFRPHKPGGYVYGQQESVDYCILICHDKPRFAFGIWNYY